MNETSLWPEAARTQRLALIVGAVALVLCAVGAFFSPAQFFQAYLFAFLFWLGVPLGCLGILMIYHLAGGVWGLVIRRPLEAAALTLPLMGALFLPLLLGLSVLYPWARPADVARDQILQHRSVYLNTPFFIARAVLYFVLWSGAAYLLNRTSWQEDRDGHTRAVEGRFRTLCRIGMVVHGFGITFAAIDWAMVLDAHWFSTIYGMLFLVGQGLTGFAFAIVVLVWLSQHPPLDKVATRNQINDLGNLLLAFVMFWAYMQLSQLLIVWSGNLPEETPWFLRRTADGWLWVTVTLAALQFFLPFILLLARGTKRSPSRLASLAGLILVMRLVDMFWMIEPEARPGGLSVHWLDLVAPIAIGGIWIAAFLWLLGRRPLLPLHDPRDPRLHQEVEHARSHGAQPGEASA